MPSTTTGQGDRPGGLLCLRGQGRRPQSHRLGGDGRGFLHDDRHGEAVEGKGIDLTGTWADTAYELKDYKIASITVTIHSPYSPSGADREFLEKEAHRCPVYLAVKDGTAVKVAFDWAAPPPRNPRAGKSCCQCA